MGETFKLRITDSVKDSKPYYEKKNVVLCRSGIQEYSFGEVMNFGLDQPKQVKDMYKVYRPASVLISSKEKMTNIPITKEHPPEFIDGENWQRYAHGYTGSEADVVSLGDGEIGIKSKLVFSTNDVYNYYLEGNQEVSLGYVSRNEWASDPEKNGYDIIMVGIEDVNHLAITTAGRGGSRVAVIDSILGGITMFKTGLFHFLKQKGKTTDSPTKLSQIVFDSLEQAKSLEGDKLEAEVIRVLDSLATLKDCESKTVLMDSVADCYKAIDTAITNKDEIARFLDSTYEKVEKETLDSVASLIKDGAEEKEKEKEETSEDSEKEKEEPETKDEDGKGTGTRNISDSKDEDNVSAIKDSLQAVIQDAFTKNNEDLSRIIDSKIDKAVKEALGLDPEDKGAGGDVQDSLTKKKIDIDMSKFVY